jgi:hypothetical protein
MHERTACHSAYPAEVRVPYPNLNPVLNLPSRACYPACHPAGVQLFGTMAKGLAAATLDPEYLARFRARPRARRGRLLAGVQAAAVGVYEGAVGAHRRKHSCDL